MKRTANELKAIILRKARDPINSAAIRFDAKINSALIKRLLKELTADGLLETRPGIRKENNRFYRKLYQITSKGWDWMETWEKLQKGGVNAWS